jgi:hypothetical protein
MICNTQNYWVFGLCPSSGILETRKHNVSESWYVSVLRWRGIGVVHWLRLALSKGPNTKYVSSPHLRTETDPLSETLCFLVSRIPDDGQSPKTQQFWVPAFAHSVYMVLLLLYVVISFYFGRKFPTYFYFLFTVVYTQVMVWKFSSLFCLLSDFHVSLHISSQV